MPVYNLARPAMFAEDAQRAEGLSLAHRSRTTGAFSGQRGRAGHEAVAPGLAAILRLQPVA